MLAIRIERIDELAARDTFVERHELERQEKQCHGPFSEDAPLLV